MISDKFNNGSGRGSSIAKKYINFKALDGDFVYYDKQGEKTVKLQYPIEFIALDQLYTIKGYHEKTNSGIVSNEVRNISFEKLDVKAFGGGKIANGYYSDIKDSIKAQGGKFTCSVYAIYDGELVNFAFYGASISPWISMQGTADKFKITGVEKKKKGAVQFYEPVFEPLKPTEKERKEAEEVLANVLNPYLDNYLKSDVEYAKKSEPKKEKQAGFDDDDLPF